jgi:hypothetical protein
MIRKSFHTFAATEILMFWVMFVVSNCSTLALLLTTVLVILIENPLFVGEVVKFSLPL